MQFKTTQAKLAKLTRASAKLAAAERAYENALSAIIGDKRWTCGLSAPDSSMVRGDNEDRLASGDIGDDTNNNGE